MRSVVAICLVLLLPQFCNAQCRSCRPATLFSWFGERESLGELGPITTDRPDFTEASSTVGLGVAQIEAGYTYVSGRDSREDSFGEPLLRYGIFANWLELRLAAFPKTDTARVSSLRQTGLEDLYLGAKIALTPQQGILPEVALVPQLTVPTGDDAFTTNRVLPGANLLYGWDLNECWTFAGSTQYNVAVNDSLVRHDEWAQSLTVGHSWNDAIGSYLEWFVIAPHDAIDVLPQHYINSGFTYLLTNDVQFDFRYGKGLSQTSDEYFLGTGVSIRFR